jgi:putative DNA primase/helicase
MNSDNALKTMARLCKFWDGASFDRVRAGDGSGSLYGRRLSMHQQAQPDVMAKLLSDPMANGQGFLARCLVAWPESTIGTRYVDRFEWSGDRAELKRLFAVLKQLMEAEPRYKGASEQELDPVDLPLDEDAQKLAMAALNQFETLMLPGNDLYEIRDRTAKAVENACRIAGVLSVIDGGMATRSISAKHLSQSLIIIQWYLKEALRIRGAAVIPQAVKDAESLSKWLDDRGMRIFRSAQVLTKGPSQLRNKARFKGAIDELMENGFLIPNESNIEIDGVKAKLSWTVCHVV